MKQAMLDFFTQNFDAVLVGAIGSMVGAATTTGFSFFVRAARFPFKGDIILGTWHHHFVNDSSEGPRYNSEIAKITKGLFSDFVIRHYSNNFISKRNLRFLGRAKREGIFLVVHGISTTSKQARYKRYVVPQSDELNLLVGIGLSQDYNGLSSANPTVLSRTPLDQIDFVKIIKKRVDTLSEISVVRVKINE